jgi:NAD(P)-dependent dehydrogenase (short-subunit alcohol dehydrogenase family)
VNVDLAEKCALVTGAAQGIGLAVANLLSANGARVAYADIDFAAAQEAAELTPHSMPLNVDISNESQVNAAITKMLEKFGRIDILVNNAGINTIKHRVNIDEFPLEEWQRIIDVDLTGTYLVSSAVARAMIPKRGGRIINISSVLGVVPARLQCAFVAAKAAVVQLTRAAAIELAEHGILVNCVAPGSTLTAGTKHLFYSDNATDKERAQKMLSHVPLGRPASVDEIAHAVLFFAAPESAYITGQTLCVDGGWSAGGFFRDF